MWKLPTILVAAWVILASVPAAPPALAGETKVAVAASFTEAAREIASAFAAATGHQALLSFGATGQLHAQIAQGAPFEVFLAADDDRPALAVADGLAVEGTVFTYAIGRLVLYCAEAGRATGARALKRGDFRQLAIANPQTAPYGAAAVEALRSLGLLGTLQPKIVQGQSIAQAFQFVESGNAELGFVALGQVLRKPVGSYWIVPQELYRPIRQDAVLLKAGEANAAAAAFLEFLRGGEAAAIIEQYGFALDR